MLIHHGGVMKVCWSVSEGMDSVTQTTILVSFEMLHGIQALYLGWQI